MPNTPNSRSARLRRTGLLQVGVLVAIVLITSLPSAAMQGDTIADRVLGQADFTDNRFSGLSASAIKKPRGGCHRHRRDAQSPVRFRHRQQSGARLPRRIILRKRSCC